MPVEAGEEPLFVLEDDRVVEFEGMIFPGYEREIVVSQYLDEPPRLALVMASPAIYDTRRKLDLKAALDAGFAYRALGVSPRRLKPKTRASVLSDARKPALNAAIAL